MQGVKERLRRVLRQRPARRQPGGGQQAAEILRLLDLMTEDNKRGHACTQPGDGGDGSGQKGWDYLAKVMRQALEAEGVDDLENQVYNQWFAGAPTNSEVYYRLYCYALYLRVGAMDRWGIIQSLRSKGFSHKSKSRIVEFDGVAFTSDSLLSLLQIFKVAEHEPAILDKPCVVVDIGGGWGRIGNALWAINPSAAYVHIDIPITSALAQYYLPTTAPDAPVYGYPTYREKRKILREDMLDKPGFHFIGSHQIDKLEKAFADTVYNIASFGEMSNATVDFYFSHIDRLCNGLFYMSQINFSNRKNGFIVGGDDYYPFSDSWEKIYVRDSDIKYQYFESLHRIRS